MQTRVELGESPLELNPSREIQAGAKSRLELEPRRHIAVARLRLMLAMELAIAVQAVEFAAPAKLDPALTAAMETVRQVVPPLDEDRALSPDIAALESALLANGALLAKLRAVATV